MTSFEFLTLLDRFSGILNENQALIDRISSFAVIWDQLSSQLLGTMPCTDPNQVNNAAIQLRNGFQQVVNSIMGLKPSLLIPEVNKFRADIEQIIAAFPNTYRGPITQLPQFIATFNDAFDAVFNSRGEPNSAANFIRAAARIRDTLTFARGILDFVRPALVFESPAPDGYQNLFLQVSCVYDISRVVHKLEALRDLYSDICRVTNQSETQYPLTLQRLELGSPISIVLTGGQFVIAILLQMLTRVGEYLYRQFSKEGRIVSVPRDVEAVEQLLRLRDLLQERGIDVSQTDETLKNTLATIAIKLNALLGGESFIRVNDQTYQLSHAGQPQLAGSDKRALPDATKGAQPKGGNVDK